MSTVTRGTKWKEGEKQNGLKQSTDNALEDMLENEKLEGRNQKSVNFFCLLLSYILSF